MYPCPRAASLQDLHTALALHTSCTGSWERILASKLGSRWDADAVMNFGNGLSLYFLRVQRFLSIDLCNNYSNYKKKCEERPCCDVYLDEMYLCFVS